MKVKVEYREVTEKEEEYDLSAEEIEKLKNGDSDIFELTDIENDALNRGDNYVEVCVYDENGKEILSY